MAHAADTVVCEAIGETYCGLLEHSLKKSSHEDAVFVIEEAFKLLFEMAASKSSVEQRASSICILRIIKASPSSFFSACADFLTSSLVALLGKRHTEAAQASLESLLSLVLSSSKVVMNQIDDILGVLVQQIGSSNPAVRKVALDIIYSLCVVNSEEMRFYREEILETIAVVKNDPDKRVREAAVEATKAIQGLAEEVTETDIGHDSKLQKSSMSHAKSKIKDVSALSGITEAAEKDRKREKTAPKKEVPGINKKNLNPNFMKASNSDIEIFFNERKPTTFPQQNSTPVPLAEPNKRPIQRPERGGISDRSHPTTDFIESRIENEIIQDHLAHADTRIESPAMGVEQPSHIHARRGVDESNIFKDFENDKDLVASGAYKPKNTHMDEERRRSPINRRAHQEHGFDIERSNRSRTPEGDYAQQMALDRKRRILSEEDQMIDKLVDKTTESIHQKIVKTNDYDIKLLKRTCEGLTKENSAQLKIIEFQTKRIDSLVSHVQNMTLHINHLLGKVNQLEQNMFQISTNRQQSPQQIIVPSYGFQLPGNSPTIDPLAIQNQMGMQNSIQGMAPQGGHPLQMMHPQQQMNYGQMMQIPQGASHRPWTADQMQGESSNNQSFQKGFFTSSQVSSGGPQYFANSSAPKPSNQFKEGSGSKSKGKDQAEPSAKGKPRGNKWQTQAVEEVEDENIITDRADNEKQHRDNRGGIELAAAAQFSKKKAAGYGRDDGRESFGQKLDEVKLNKRASSDVNYLDDNRTSANFMIAESTQHDLLDDERDSAFNESAKGNFDKGGLGEEDFEEDKDEAANEANTDLRVVLAKDNRKILDYLSDDGNLNQFSHLSTSTIKRLALKLADLLLCRVESYIEIVIPWLIACIESRSLRDEAVVANLSSSLKTVLSAGKGSKTYKQELLQTLESLRRGLEKQ
jgi:hypothetical protein